MRIIITLLYIAISCSSFAQTDTSYHLLWYRGKKIKANMLLSPGGDTIRYDPVKGSIKVTSRSGAGKAFDDMQAELGKTSQRMEQMLVQISGLPKPILPPLSLAIKRSFTEADEDLRSLLSNKLLLPDTKLAGIKSAAGKGMSYDISTLEEGWDDLIREFHDFIASSQETNTDIPEPPRFDFSYCFQCDTTRRAAYKNALSAFREALIGKKDFEMMTKARAASRLAEESIMDKKEEIQKEIINIICFIMNRSRARVIKAIDRYIDEPEYAMAVMDVAVSTEREQQLMGYGNLLPDYASRAFTAYSKRIQKALDEMDYSIALNHDLVFFVERKTQVYNRRIQGLLEKVLKFNLFKMNMRIAAKASGNDGSLEAGLEGDNWLSAYVDNKRCRLSWCLVGPKKDKLTMTLTKAELHGANGGGATYVGSKTWLANIPTVKLDFCSGEIQDSIIASPFFVEGYNEYWNFPHLATMNVQMANNVLIGCFIDVERTKEEAADYKADPEKLEKLKQQMMAKYSQLGKTGGQGSGAASMNMANLGQLANTGSISKDISELIQSVNPGRYIFTPVVHNKDKLIVMDKLDGKILFPKNTATEYADFYITIENDANGKYSWSK